jgi:hypothetical protein
MVLANVMMTMVVIFTERTVRMTKTMPNLYEQLKEIDYVKYRKAVLFAQGIMDNANQMRKNRAGDLEIGSYTEQEIIKYTVTLLTA